MKVGDKIFIKGNSEEVIIRFIYHSLQKVVVSYKYHADKKYHQEVNFWDIEDSEYEKPEKYKPGKHTGKIKKEQPTGIKHNESQTSILKEMGLDHLIKK